MSAARSLERRRAGPHAWLMECLAMGAGDRAAQGMGLGRVLLAFAMIGLGLRGLAFGDFASTWQRIPISHLPAHDLFVYATAAIELATGIGLLVPYIAKISAAAMSVFALLWLVLLKVPGILSAPGEEAKWLAAGEIAVILAGAWTAFAMLTQADGRFFSGRTGVRNARLLAVLGLPPIGLSHFFYAEAAAAYVPEWLPAPYFWTYLTGAGDLAAAIGILFAVWPRLAATMAAAMLWVISLLVWLPPLIAHANGSIAWSAFLMSSAIAAGVSVVADSYRGARWFALGPQG